MCRAPFLLRQAKTESITAFRDEATRLRRGLRNPFRSRSLNEPAGNPGPLPEDGLARKLRNHRPIETRLKPRRSATILAALDFVNRWSARMLPVRVFRREF